MPVPKAIVTSLSLRRCCCRERQPGPRRPHPDRSARPRVPAHPTCSRSRSPGSSRWPAASVMPFTATVTLRSATNVTLKGVFFDYELDSPISHRRPTPTMSWRLGHRKWQALPLPFWTPASAKTDAFWESNDTLIGSIAAHSKHSLQMRITFHKRDHSGLYDGQIAFGAPACRNGQMMIGFGEINFAYQP